MATAVIKQSPHNSQTGIDPLHFRQVLASYPTGVAVITAATDQGWAGMCVGTFTSISLDPPLVGFFPKLGSETLDRIIQAGHFCVNVIGANHEHLSRKFTGPWEDRFVGIRAVPAASGAPRLEESVLWIDCTLERVVEIGDHALVVGRVHDLGTEKSGAEPLVFHRGSYSTLSQR
jgi:3-hydroxy-9,10-secoandrosta-1,3,5(10)-triene-9,17-dione monooxygenase reductase component